MKKHLKRLNAPKHWMLDKLGGAFVSRENCIIYLQRRCLVPRKTVENNSYCKIFIPMLLHALFRVFELQFPQQKYQNTKLGKTISRPKSVLRRIRRLDRLCLSRFYARPCLRRSPSFISALNCSFIRPRSRLKVLTKPGSAFRWFLFYGTS